MASISDNNKLTMRPAMEVYCSMTSRTKSVDLTITKPTSGVKVMDSNIDITIDSETWKMKQLTDLQGEGFSLAEECELYENVAGSESNKKIGIRSNIGEGLSFTINANATIPAVTIAFTGNSEGTLTANGVEYEIKRVVVVPVNGKKVSVDIVNLNSDARIEIASITPGITLEFENENIISCVVSLRSSLAIDNPSWQISDIEIQAYWPDDISEAITNLNDDVPITYYAGYPGDYSPVRKFYLSEPCQQKDNVITIKGEDASHKLEDASNIAVQRLTGTAKYGQQNLYNWLKKCITGAGIKLESTQNAPGASGASTTERSLLFLEGSRRDHVQGIINLAHKSNFWPVFVDAGIPTLRWAKPNPEKEKGNRNGSCPVWKIYEEDCGETARTVERNIASITTDDSYGLKSTLTKKSTWSKLEENLTIKKDVQQTKNFSNYYWAYSVKYKKSTKWNTPISFAWIPSHTSVQKNVKTKEKYKSGKNKGKYKYKKQWFYKPTLYGKRLLINAGNKTIVEAGKRPGTQISVKPIVYGQIYQGTSLVYPDYNNLFSRSNICGSFIWRGDPRMQPRDIFKFVRKEKDAQGKDVIDVCTIESIVITHEAGGTKSEITYRKGVV